MKLNETQVNLINQILNVPLLAFGYEKFENEIGKKGIENIKNIQIELNKIFEIKNENIPFIKKCIVFSSGVIGDVDMKTLTGHNSEEAEEILSPILK